MLELTGLLDLGRAGQGGQQVETRKVPGSSAGKGLEDFL